MKIKSVLCMSLTMMLSTAPSLAEESNIYGVYPEHTTFTSVPKAVNSIVTPGASPGENVFYVEGENRKGFVLLDKDKDGNFFVIAEEEYGTHWFTSKSGEVINNATVSDSDWTFNPENPDSIAYWLENDFWNNGNKGMSLPENIKENILTREWAIENNFTQKQVSKNSVGEEAYAEYEAWLGMKDALRMVTSKLSLISYTEYNTYKDKIGAVASRNSDAWAGFMTRTVKSKASMVNATSGSYPKRVKYENNFLHIGGANSQTVVRCNVDGDLSTQCQNSYYVRPVFWLDKDFFKKEKIELSTAGTNVIDIIKSLKYADLSEVYTDEEIATLGINTESVPEAANVIPVGLKAPGALLEMVYDYENDYTENGTEFENYISDSADGIYSLLSCFERVKLDVQGIADKYMKIAVIPKNNEGASGKRAWSDTFFVKDTSEAVVSECLAVKGETEVKVDVTFSIAEAGRSVTVALYDKDNVLKNTVTEDSSGETILSAVLTGAEILDDDIIRIIVKNKIGKVIYLKSI